MTVSEVCRRHSLSPSVLYRWRAVAQGGSAVALKRDAQRKPRKDDPEARHKAEMERPYRMNINASLSESGLHQLTEVFGANGNPGALTAGIRRQERWMMSPMGIR